MFSAEEQVYNLFADLQIHCYSFGQYLGYCDRCHFSLVIWSYAMAGFFIHISNIVSISFLGTVLYKCCIYICVYM